MTRYPDDAASAEDVARELTEAGTELRAATEEMERAMALVEASERALAAAESVIDVVLAITPVPLVVIDRDLKVWAWSQGAERSWSVPADQVVGRRWPAVARHLEGVPTNTAWLDQLFASGTPGTSTVLNGGMHAILTGRDKVDHLVLVRRTS